MMHINQASNLAVLQITCAIACEAQEISLNIKASSLVQRRTLHVSVPTRYTAAFKALRVPLVL
jgi:hypothetical protein